MEEQKATIGGARSEELYPEGERGDQAAILGFG
jgi:hypothetical protein